MKALRDEFLERTNKINQLNEKIKELSLFKLEIEYNVRQSIEEHVVKVKLQIVKAKL
jgi:hypothetical protein